MGFQDTHDAFEYARKSWDKYGLGVDFDTAWQTYYDNHYDPEHYEDWVDPIWSQEAWDALVIENGGDPSSVPTETVEFDDELGENVKEAFDLMTASDVVRKMYQKFPEIEFVSESDQVGGNVLLIFELPKGIINKLEQITNWLEQHGVDVSFSGKYLKVSVPEDEMDESLRTKLFKKIGCYSDGSPMEESFEDDYETHYDAAHAEEWMDKHPYGYYNNEDDYGLDDDMDWEGYDDLEENVNNLAYKNARKFYDWVEATDPYDQDITFEKSNGVYTVTQTFDESGTAVLNVFYPDGKVYVNNLAEEGAYDTDRFNSFEEFCDAYQIEINESLTEGAMTNGSYSLYTGWVKVPDKDSIPDKYPELEPEYSE